MSKEMEELRKLKRYLDMYDNDKVNKNIAEKDFEKLSKRIRGKAYLNYEEFVKIAFWKLKDAPHLKTNMGNIIGNEAGKIKEITAQAFAEPDDLEKIKILCNKEPGKKLAGVGIPVASTILTFRDHVEYGILDSHVQSALNENFGILIGTLKNNKSSFVPEDYKKYLDLLRNRFRKKLNRLKVDGKDDWTAREIDKALFASDKWKDE